MNNKQKLIKSGLFAGATILVLIVATVAWFLSGGNADVNNVQAGVDPGLYSSYFYESPDANKDGKIDNPENWVAVTDPVIHLSNMVPGEKHFYKMVVNINKPLNLSLTLKNIVTAPFGTTTKQQLLEHINVEWSIKNSTGADLNGTTPFDGSMISFLGNAESTEKIVYNSLDLSSYTKSYVSIYYTVGITGGSIVGADDILQGSSFSIGNFALDLTEK